MLLARGPGVYDAVQCSALMEVVMAFLTVDQQLAREVLLRTFPGANVVDDDTLDAVVRQEPVDLPKRESSAALDISHFIEVLKQYLPIVVSLLGIIKTSYELATPKATYKPPSADEVADAVISKLASAPKLDRQQVIKAAHNALKIWSEKRDG
jgi:hypothetical protein